MDPNPSLTVDGEENLRGEAASNVSERQYGSPPVDWPLLVQQIQRGDSAGMEQLYRIFGRGIRFYLCRQLGPQDLEDRFHDTFVIVVQAIQRGELREPERLMGFVRTIVRRQVAAHIDDAVHRRREEVDIDNGARLAAPAGDPEETAIREQRRELMKRILQRMASRDREILTRFYLHEQTQEQICEEMSLTETQFRLLKSRAKARFGDLGKRKLQHKALSAVFMRSSAAGSH
jgi:RNA polymerase sigma factor (sigma-70 family)